MSEVEIVCEACGPGCFTTMLSHIGRLSGAAGLKKSVMLRLGGISTLLNDNRVDNSPVEVRTYFNSEATQSGLTTR